jgi:uncharacterized protein YydD (DUF2326 family)
MNSRDEYVRKLKTKLDELNSEIDALSVKAEEAATHVRKEYDEQISFLKEKQTAARLKIAELQHAREDAWGDLKSGIDLAWTAMSEALDSARSRFK